MEWGTCVGGACGHRLRQADFQNQRIHHEGMVSVFYTVRREGETLQDAYEDGKISRVGKRIYDIVSDGHVALHEIKTLGQFRKEDKVNFDRTMIELQMGMYTTMTGRKQKRNRFGEEYGWNSTVFTTVENFWSERGYSIPELDATDCYEKIRQQILRLKPAADQRTIRKFITGS